MAGGAGRVELDGVDDYLELRQRRFGMTHAPLPASLRLSAEDEAFNSRISWTGTLAH
jgi:hypothetical protein